MSSPYSGATGAGQGYSGAEGYSEGYAEGFATDPAPTRPVMATNTATQSHYDVSGNEAANMGTPMTEEGRPAVEGTSVGQLIGEVTKDLSTLMRQELDLAKAELKVEAKKAGQGAGMFGAAGFAGYMVLVFLSLALMWGLANVMDTGWAGLIVAAIWAVIGAVAFVMGRNRFRQVNPKPERTVDTLQQVPSALKPN
jgi:hypothetical protein